MSFSRQVKMISLRVRSLRAKNIKQAIEIARLREINKGLVEENRRLKENQNTEEPGQITLYKHEGDVYVSHNTTTYKVNPSFVQYPTQSTPIVSQAPIIENPSEIVIIKEIIVNQGPIVESDVVSSKKILPYSVDLSMAIKYCNKVGREYGRNPFSIYHGVSTMAEVMRVALNNNICKDVRGLIYDYIAKLADNGNHICVLNNVTTTYWNNGRDYFKELKYKPGECLVGYGNNYDGELYGVRTKEGLLESFYCRASDPYYSKIGCGWIEKDSSLLGRNKYDAQYNTVASMLGRENIMVEAGFTFGKYIRPKEINSEVTPLMKRFVYEHGYNKLASFPLICIQDINRMFSSDSDDPTYCSIKFNRIPTSFYDMRLNDYPVVKRYNISRIKKILKTNERILPMKQWQSIVNDLVGLCVALKKIGCMDYDYLLTQEFLQDCIPFSEPHNLGPLFKPQSIVVATDKYEPVYKNFTPNFKKDEVEIIKNSSLPEFIKNKLINGRMDISYRGIERLYLCFQDDAILANLLTIVNELIRDKNTFFREYKRLGYRFTIDIPYKKYVNRRGYTGKVPSIKAVKPVKQIENDIHIDGSYEERCDSFINTFFEVDVNILIKTNYPFTNEDILEIDSIEFEMAHEELFYYLLRQGYFSFNYTHYRDNYMAIRKTNIYYKMLATLSDIYRVNIMEEMINDAIISYRSKGKYWDEV